MCFVKLSILGINNLRNSVEQIHFHVSLESRCRADPKADAALEATCMHLFCCHMSAVNIFVMQVLYWKHLQIYWMWHMLRSPHISPDYLTWTWNLTWSRWLAIHSAFHIHSSCEESLQEMSTELVKAWEVCMVHMLTSWLGAPWHIVQIWVCWYLFAAWLQLWEERCCFGIDNRAVNPKRPKAAR